MTTAVLLTVFMASGCTFYNKLKARDHLNKGVQAYEVKDYVKADEHFTQAIELDPDLLHAWLYKATTYRVQVIPNVYTEDNKKRATDAIKAFEDVLKKDDKNINAIASIASLYTDPLQDHDTGGTVAPETVGCQSEGSGTAVWNSRHGFRGRQ